MSFLHESVSKPRTTRTTSLPTRDVGPVFGVGMRAFVNDAARSVDGFVALSDARGKVAVGYLADGTEVEILAWIPRRVTTVYRVQTTDNHLTGWLGVASLRSNRHPLIITSPMPAPTPVWVSVRAPSGKPSPASVHRRTRGPFHAKAGTGTEASEASIASLSEESGKKE